jgi:putative acetyltransferase
MINIIKTDSDNPDFIGLVVLLDQYLAIIDGEEHAFYAQLNKPQKMNHVIVGYENDKPVGCGAIKKYSEETAEIKRMFVIEEYRGQGIAKRILRELETWARELNYSYSILETGKNQPTAICFYQKSGYKIIPSYGQYIQIENSVCLKKTL